MKRRGTSLMEVLIAIFILALGLVSLLTLFPIGFVQMAKSVQDERAAQLAANAAAYMRTVWKDASQQSSRNISVGKQLFTDVFSLNSFVAAMDDPNIYMRDFDLQQLQNSISLSRPKVMTQWPVLIPALGMGPVTPNTPEGGMQRLDTRATLTRPSFPVFVDPVGWQAAGSVPQRDWLGFRNNSSYAIPRRTIAPMTLNGSAISPKPAIQTIRNCMLQDDMEYSGDGVPKLGERVSQYSCAWMLRRENNSLRSETNVTVVVYHRRSIASPSEEMVFDNTPGRAVAPVVPNNVGSPAGGSIFIFPNSITLNYTAANRPPLRRGGWILDATIDPALNPNALDKISEIQGFYYRVTDFTESETATPGLFQNVLQLDTRLRSRQVEISPPPGGASPRLIIVQDRVLEVFDKGPMEMNSPCRTN